MAKDRQTIRNELRDNLRVDPNGKVWSDSVLNTIIHEAELELARRNISITELETTTTYTTTIGKRNDDLPSDLLRVISVLYDVETVANYTAATIAFNDANPDTITDTANGFGSFTAGMKLQVEGSTSNDGTDALEVDTAAAGTLTLTTASSVTAEAAGSSVTLVGRSNPDHQTWLQRVEDIREIEKGGFNNILGYPTKYAVFNNDIYYDVLPKEADTVKVTYVKTPALMASDGTNSDIPDELIPLVKWWAEFLAWSQIPGSQESTSAEIALRRFEQEVRRKTVMRSLDDYGIRRYRSADWGSNRGYHGANYYKV
jgi:hypothetical protein